MNRYPEGVSIIIRSFNEEELIGRCVAAIKSQLIDLPVEIVVIDSESTDNTVSIARANECIVHEIKKIDFTFGMALNRGIAVSHFRYIVSISAHCIPKDDHWLSSLIDPLRVSEAEMCFGPHIGATQSRTSERNYFRLKFMINRGLCDRPLMNNGNSAFLRDIWDKRKFDSELPAQEDLEFCLWHMKNSEARLYFNDDALVVHFHNDRNRRLYKRLYKELAVELHLGIRGWRDFAVFVSRIPLCIYRDFVSAEKAGVLEKALKGILAFRAVEFYAYIRALLTYKKFVSRGWKP